MTQLVVGGAQMGPLQRAQGREVAVARMVALLEEAAARGVEVLGISPDSPEKLAKFRERDGLTITLLSDPDKHVHEEYGAYGEKKLYGKTVEGVIRSTFVVGEDGKISDARYNVKATGHVAKLRKDLGL